MDDAMLRAAQAYCGLGIRCFLVAADGRTPIKAEGWFERGVHDATADADDLTKRLGAYPGANLAFACGPGSGFFVVDLDCKDGKDGRLDLDRMQSVHGQLPPRPISTTPSTGEHHFFSQPNRALRNRVSLKIRNNAYEVIESWPGIDIRAAGGSACAPPSRRRDGVYAWKVSIFDLEPPPAPEWLLRIIDPPEPPRKPKPVKGQSPDRISRYVEEAVDDEVTQVSQMGPGTGRNHRLYHAAIKLGTLVGANVLPREVAEDELLDAARACGLAREDGEHAVKATIASGLRFGIANPRELDLGR